MEVEKGVEAKRILIVDDEPDVRLLLNRRLAAHHYQILEAADGRSAIEYARREAVDLIILDIMMPGEDGIEIYQTLRTDAATRHIPILFLTALSGDGSLTERGLELMALSKHGIQMDEYFVVMGKPYDPKRLLREIRRLLGERVDFRST